MKFCLAWRRSVLMLTGHVTFGAARARLFRRCERPHGGPSVFRPRLNTKESGLVALRSQDGFSSSPNARSPVGFRSHGGQTLSALAGLLLPWLIASMP